MPLGLPIGLPDWPGFQGPKLLSGLLPVVISSRNRAIKGTPVYVDPPRWMPVIAIIRNFEDYSEALLVSETYEASGGEMSETGIVYKSVAELSQLIES